MKPPLFEIASFYNNPKTKLTMKNNFHKNFTSTKVERFFITAKIF